MLTLKRFVVDVLVSKKVIIFPLSFLFFFSFSSFFFKTRGGEGRGSGKEKTMLSGGSGMALQLPGS